MKAVLVSLCLLPSLALAEPTQPEGTFISPTQTFDVNLQDEASCKESNGRWESEICVLDVEDAVVVSKKDGEYYLEVTTWGSNLHQCMYDGVAKLEGDTLVSETKTEFSEEPGVCRIEVRYLDESTVTVSEGEGSNCRDWCGARAFGFGIGSAVRK
jgi:hypothetical protein